MKEPEDAVGNQNSMMVSLGWQGRDEGLALLVRSLWESTLKQKSCSSCAQSWNPRIVMPKDERPKSRVETCPGTMQWEEKTEIDLH